MTVTDRLASWLTTLESALETRQGRLVFWLAVAAAFVGVGISSVVRAEFPQKKFVPKLNYNSPVEIGESQDAQAKWRSSEFRGFRQIAWGVVMERRDPYSRDPAEGVGHIRAYPPFFGLAFFPFAVPWRVPGLGSGLYFVVGFLLSLLAAWYAARWDGQARFGRFALLYILFAPLALDTMARAESDMYVIFPVALAFCWLAQQRRRAAAGALLGFAACFKVLPGLFGVYLICTRQWRALAGMIAAGVFCMMVLPLAIWGPARTEQLYRSWYGVVVAPYHAGSGAGAFIENPFRESNQSMTAALTRYLRPVPAKFPWGERRVNLLSLDPETVRRVVKALQVLVSLGLAGLWLWRGGTRETATVVALMATVPTGILLFSEISLTTHHVLLLLPLAAILVRAERPGDSARRWLWVIATYLAALLLTALLKPLAPLFFATVLLLIACVALAIRNCTFAPLPSRP